jgi:hypothetical protein
MDIEHAQDRLRRVAQAVTERSEPEAVSRLLERLSTDQDAAALRDALVLAGAASVLHDVRCNAKAGEARGAPTC